MRIPWSISTTVRNPERIREFLRVLKQSEGQEFNERIQIKYQVLLIEERKSKIVNNFVKEFYKTPIEKVTKEVA